MEDNESQSTLQSGVYTAEQREKDRESSYRHSALHLAQKNSVDRNDDKTPAQIVEDAEIFFAFLNK